MDPTALPGYLEHLSYAGIFALLAFLDVFVPLPEELVLLGIGYAAAFETLNETAVVAIALAALLLGDNTSFWLARAGGRWLHRLMRRGGERAFPSRYAEKMRANMGRTLIAMTFLPNVRFFAPIVAGTVGTPWRRFIVYDALGVLLYVGVYLTLGYHFHLQLDRLVRGFELYRHAAVYALLLAGVAGLGVFWHRRRSAP